MRGLAFAALLLAAAACQPQLQLEPTRAPASGKSVVVASEGGRLPTRTFPITPSPTPTVDLVALVPTVLAFPTRTPGPPPSPTATLQPAFTSTPRPTPTRMTGSFPRLPTFTPTPRPTRTPRPKADPEEIELTRTARITPSPEPPEPDFLEPNDTPARATLIEVGEVIEDLSLHALDDVDVFAVEVDEPDTTLVVSLNAPRLTGYALDIAAPGGGNVGRRRVDGTVTLRSVADVRSQTGRYYVYVRRVGALPPEGPYSIAASLVGPSAPPTELE